MSNGVLEPIRGMGAAGDVWGSQLSSKAPAASGRATWGPPASCWGWVSSSEGVSVGMQERGERGHHIAPQLGFLPPPPSRFTLVPVPGVLLLPEGTDCPAGHPPCREPDGAFPFLYTSPVQSQVYQTNEFCRLTAVCLSGCISL